MGDQLLPLPLTERSVHLCVDMQRIFSAEGPWPTPWMDRVLPVAAALANRHPERTVFTRFIPPERPDQMPGMWRRYYTRWRMATRECLDLRLLELMPPLAAFCPPATVINKTRYSALAEPKLAEHLRQREADALIVSGSETDVCVLATVLDAVDIGYRVIVVRDAVCSSSDEGHNMLMRLYHARYTEQRDNPHAMGMTFDPSSALGVTPPARCHQRYASPSDPRITYTRELPWEDSAMSSDLTELGRDAIAAVSRGVADGAPLVKCQLLASAFYEALRNELRKADATKRSTLLAVTHQCHRSAAANISPVQALAELKRAIDLLQPVFPASETVQPLPRSRPVLRVIQGGLSSN